MKLISWHGTIRRRFSYSYDSFFAEIYRIYAKAKYSGHSVRYSQNKEILNILYKSEDSNNNIPKKMQKYHRTSYNRKHS